LLKEILSAAANLYKADFYSLVTVRQPLFFEFFCWRYVPMFRKNWVKIPTNSLCLIKFYQISGQGAQRKWSAFSGHSVTQPNFLREG